MTLQHHLQIFNTSTLLLACFLIGSFGVRRAEYQEIEDTVSLCSLNTGVSISTCDNAFSRLVRGTAKRATCIRGQAPEECLSVFRREAASLHVVDGVGFERVSEYGLVPVLAEVGDGPDGGDMFAVAITTRGVCEGRRNDSTNLSFLQGLRGCFSGYRNWYGWTLPVGLLASQGLLHQVSLPPDVQMDAKSVAALFSKVCAPGIHEDGPLAGGGLWKQGLCTACQGPCSSSDPYFGGPGAIDCVARGDGDVAFLDHRSLLAHLASTDNGTVNSIAPSELRLVCPWGECLPLEPLNYQQCHLAKVPPRTVMTTPSFSQSAVGSSILTRLHHAGKGDSNDRQAVVSMRLISGVDASLRGVNISLQDYLGANLTAVFEGYKKLTSLNISFCTVGEEEQKLCDQLVPRMNVKSFGAQFTCVGKKTTDDCMAAMEDESGLVRLFDMTDMYKAHRNHNLKVITAEEFVPELDRYAVAVVRKEMCDGKRNITLKDLRGRGLCSAGYLTPEGWHLPGSFMLSSGLMDIASNHLNVMDDAESMVNFFGPICAPGVRGNGPVNTTDGVGQSWSSTCRACKGDCSSDPSKEAYSGEGAMRCLMDGRGGVAFVSTRQVNEFLSASSASFLGPLQDQFALVCPEGGPCQPLDNSPSCNLGQISAPGFMVKSSYLAARQLQTVILQVVHDPEIQQVLRNTTRNPEVFMTDPMSMYMTAVHQDTLSYLGPQVGGLKTMVVMRGRDTQVKREPHVRPGGHVQLTVGMFSGILVASLVMGALLMAGGRYGWRSFRNTQPLRKVAAGELPEVPEAPKVVGRSASGPSRLKPLEVNIPHGMVEAPSSSSSSSVLTKGMRIDSGGIFPVKDLTINTGTSTSQGKPPRPPRNNRTASSEKVM